jgi:crotonobetainyl-CoA:carnitine CoA-transferase CaiB-like acyl-CoA transferase
MSLTGTPESGPTRVGTAVGDLTAGMWVAMGVLAACIERQKSGRGQRVETSLLASLIGLLSVQGQRYLSVGEIPQPCGNVHPVIAPYGTFDTADGPLNLAPATQDMWLRLCDVLELPELVRDPRFLTNAERMKNRLVLKELLEASLRRKTRMTWTPLMIAAGIPAGPINTLEDVFADEQVQACGLVETVEHPLLGALRQVALPIKMAGTEHGSVRSAPPLFGQHTREVLEDYGMTPEAIQQLLEKKVVFQSS